MRALLAVSEQDRNEAVAIWVPNQVFEKSDRGRHPAREAALSLSAEHIRLAALVGFRFSRLLLRLLGQIFLHYWLAQVPESRAEVETIAGDLPKPSTILLGDHATKTAFERLPLSQ